MSENGETTLRRRSILPRMTLPAHSVCYRALSTRDARFDGRLFVGVTTTGVYCRPICPARTPKPGNCRFYPSAAAAQGAGFRPCLRCRPEVSPDAAAWRGTSNTVSRALALIAEGALDGGRANVQALAERLGMGERQLRRLFEQHLGVPPISVAQTRRILFAKLLIQETSLAMAEIAEASGFGSVRRFNDAFKKLYRRSPRELRVRKRPGPSAVTLRLGYRPPYDWEAILSFLAARAIDGIEWIANDRYSRSIAVDGAVGSVEVTPARGCLIATIRITQVRTLLSIVARLRRLFDLDANVEAIGAHLKRDEDLAALIAHRPGLRSPGAWAGFEQAVRAVVGWGEAVSTARRLTGRLVGLAGTPTTPEATGNEHLIRVFPTPEQLLAADLSQLGLPAKRARTLRALARLADAEQGFFEPVRSSDEVRARLSALPGFGPSITQDWALRALRDGDAFPAADLVLLKSPVVGNGDGLSAKWLRRRAERWRPWRAYAAQHLWTADTERRSEHG